MAQQTAIPGTTPGSNGDRNEELEDVIAEFVEARYQKLDAQKVEKERHAVVLLKMQELQIPFYEFTDEDGTIFELRREPGAEKVKCKRIKGDEGGDEDEGED